MGVNLEKVALVLGGLAFQLHIITMAMSNYRIDRDVNRSKSKDDAVQAFLILAYLLLLASFVLLLLQNFSDLKSKTIQCITIFTLIAAAVCVLIGLAIFGDFHKKGTDSRAHSMTTYSIGGISGLAAGICLIASVFCGK